MSETLTITTPDGAFSTYVARPQAAKAPAIVVIQEIFGVNPGIRQKCDRLAEAGYLAVAPDLFWRIEPGIDITDRSPEQMQQALAYIPRFNQDQGVRDIEATIHHIRRTLGVAKVGCVGYCLGGRLAFMTAARTDIDASVGYYGVGIDGLLGEKHAIANPLMLHIPTADGFVSRETQALMHEGLDDHPKVTLHDYPGEDHGFATEMGKRRSEAGAKLADDRTAEFFAQHVG